MKLTPKTKVNYYLGNYMDSRILICEQNTGAQEMFRNGLLATVEVNRLAKAHVMVFEEMNKTAFGRCIYFDQVRSEDEFEKLARETGIEMGANGSFNGTRNHDIKLSNLKLCRLMSITYRCNNEY